MKNVLKAKNREQRKRMSKETRKYLEDNWNRLREWRQTDVAKKVAVVEQPALFREPLKSGERCNRREMQGIKPQKTLQGGR